MKKSIKILFFILLIVIMAISSIIVLKNSKEDIEEEKIIEQVIETAYQKNSTEDLEEEHSNINIKNLYEQNKDIIAWIRINNSNINTENNTELIIYSPRERILKKIWNKIKKILKR